MFTTTLPTNATLTYALVYVSIVACGRVLIYRLSLASSRVKFQTFGANLLFPAYLPKSRARSDILSSNKENMLV